MFTLERANTIIEQSEEYGPVTFTSDEADSIAALVQTELVQKLFALLVNAAADSMRACQGLDILSDTKAPELFLRAQGRALGLTEAITLILDEAIRKSSEPEGEENG